MKQDKNQMSTSTRILFLPLFSILLMFSCGQSEQNCLIVKTGRFFYYSKMLNDKILVERNDSTQIEFRNNKIVSKSRISWKSSCSYDMFVNSLNNNLSEQDSIIASIPLHVEIIASTKDYYVCKSSMTRPDMKLEMKDTLYLLK